MVAREIPGGTYACFRSEGEQPKAMIDTWQEIWSAPLKRSFQVDYEVHRASEPQRVDILIGFEA
jgi:predicted transcriptional regulator YdeE